MTEQMLKVFDDCYWNVNSEIEEYIKTGWRVDRFETKVIDKDYNRVVVTVLFER